ncbi:hypothetical protein [Bacteroides gallinaceum]|nr:hypothetical protein [Bacteroides gallinaceum]MDM8153439.1 hypothetical protein [Bacteroides gallinaceum]
MKTGLSKYIGKVIPYLIFILLIPLSFLYWIGTGIGRLIRKAVRK